MVYHQCFTWMLQRLTEVVLLLTSTASNSENIIGSAPHDILPDLPSDVIVDILSRLPAECVLKCRKVCKRWLVLTSSPHFSQLHLKRAVPVLVMQMATEFDVCNTDCHSLYIFDSKLRLPRAGSLKMIGNDGAALHGSGNGFLVLEHEYSYTYVVCNLVTRECVTVKKPPTEEQQPPPVEGASAWVWCGILFHSGIGENILVFWQQLERGQFRYTMYMLSSKLWSKKASTFTYRPRDRVDPVVFNNRLHWMAKSSRSCTSSVVSCDTDVEGFRSMPHPGGECGSRHKLMYLLELEGKLTLGHYQDPSIAIWVLEDYDTWSWSLKYNVNLLLDIKCGPRRSCAGTVDNWMVFNGELIFNWLGIGMIGYHLERRTTRRFDALSFNSPSRSGYGCNAVPYTKCFVSLSSKTCS